MSVLHHKCLTMTASFETSKKFPQCFGVVVGNFDGAGLSFGAIQWNVGAGTLQPLMKDIYTVSSSSFEQSFYDISDDILNWLTNMNQKEQLQWIIKQQSNSEYKKKLFAGFNKLGTTSACQLIQVNRTMHYYKKAVSMVSEYGLWSGRAYALMFDIAVQNGSIKSNTKKLILDDFNKIDKSLEKDKIEIAMMQSVANRRAEAANPQWVEDVRSRKLTIANGEGKVHGIVYNLEKDFEIDMILIDHHAENKYANL